MSVAPTNVPSGSRLWRGVSAGCFAVAAFAWFLLVLRDQYGVASLGAVQQATLDALVLAGALGALLSRSLERRSPVARWTLVLQVTLLLVTTSAAVVAGEYA